MDHNGKQNAELEQSCAKVVFFSELRSKAEPSLVNSDGSNKGSCLGGITAGLGR